MFHKTILLTGATGYIGSHAWCKLIHEGYRVIGLDNLSNSKISVLERVKQITRGSLEFVKADVRNQNELSDIFINYDIDAVMHFAGLKSVGESLLEPMRYYENNVQGSLTLFKVMARNNVKSIVFSSTANLYGEQAIVPISESSPIAVSNPYGRSKLMVEDILRDYFVADKEWRVGLLRYFNPVGAHESGLIGENPVGIPNNLLPYIAQVAIGQRPYLSVFGADYPTIDGTGVRDYIHVLDLVDGHIHMLKKLLDDEPSVQTYNLGTGNGTSVLQMVRAFERASGKSVPYQLTARRDGDIATSYADAKLANANLGWIAKRNIDQMCEDAWRWETMRDGIQ